MCSMQVKVDNKEKREQMLQEIKGLVLATWTK